ncbi:unnamed protein product [Rhizoctonia solani]|uniref:Uncharacterized protein n=1 Tax=Rhizoctonia solani TaxID=456999 RepID=A0A8H3CN04_9AGAM|nr:unnamed protein product [Rhizoctonia solani]
MEPYSFRVSIIEQCGTHSSDAHRCSWSEVSTLLDKSNISDWYWVYRCSRPAAEFRFVNQDCQFEGYEYFVNYNLTTSNSQNENLTTIQNMLQASLPRFWLVDPRADSQVLAPYLLSPMEPELGWYTIYKTKLTQRRFIVSPSLRDAITGSDPTYSTTFLFPWSQIRRQPLQETTNVNQSISAIGIINRPEFGEFYKETARSRFVPGQRGPTDLCEITEEYRITSSFDMLASVGGLLALLQGIHTLLFGRPLFWGMFGAKLITPFGLAGQLTTKGFKKRLRERYHRTSQPHEIATTHSQDVEANRAAVNIDMTQFLLDYVIDMGPASLPTHDGNHLRGKFRGEQMGISARRSRDAGEGNETSIS